MACREIPDQQCNYLPKLSGLTLGSTLCISPMMLKYNFDEVKTHSVHALSHNQIQMSASEINIYHSQSHFPFTNLLSSHSHISREKQQNFTFNKSVIGE